MGNPNIALVQNLYAAFARADIDTILDALTRDIEWHSGSTADVYPIFGAREGIPDVGDFFRQVLETQDFSEFTPREFYGDGDKVFVLGSYSLTVKSTGRKVQSDFCHIFTLRDGRVSRFREFTDTAQFAAAVRS